MSIEVMYPSRHQSRAQNPLFARKFRRQRLGFMLAATTFGLGLLLLQFIPITAQAGAVPAEVKSTPVAASEAIKAPIPASKVVRQIQIYGSAH